MATFYLDYINGNDANNGSTWALAWKTLTAGPTAARIAPGDTVRIAKSPDPTSLGVNGTWTGTSMIAAVAPVSSTNTTPIQMTATDHGLFTGDSVLITGHTTNTRANGIWIVGSATTHTFALLNADGSDSVGNGVGGATGLWRKFTNSVITLASSVTQNIALCGNRITKTNWTASANVTSTIINTDFKEGAECQQLAVAVGFTTGKAAYFPTGTLNLSGYQQVSFWIKQTVGTIGAAGSVSLVLCSDTLGDTVVNTISIPALGALAQWSPITVDLGSALGSSIQSIAFYINTDNGAQTFLFDNIIACKASTAPDSLSLTSLVGKQAGPYTGIQSINGTRVVLDAYTNAQPTMTNLRGYYGTSETVPVYKRETIKTPMAALTTSVVQELQDSGTEGNLITFEGGYNTVTSLVDGLTIFDGQNGLGSGIYNLSKTWTSLSLSAVRYYVGVYYTTSAIYNEVNVELLANNAFYALYFQNSGTCNINVTAAVNNNTAGVLIQSNNCNVNVTNSSSNVASGTYISGNSCIALVNMSANNGGQGLYLVGDHNTAVINDSPGNANSCRCTGVNYLKNSVLNSTVKVGSFGTVSNQFLWSTNENGDADTHFGYTEGGLISSDTVTRHSPSGISWKISPLTPARNSMYPLPLKIATAACIANVPITVSAWFRRTNTGLTARFRCPPDQLFGVSEQIVYASAAADTWEQLSITVTPTQKGVLEFWADCWGGTTYSCYVDDVTIA